MTPVPPGFGLPDHTVRLIVKNGTKARSRLYLRPWGDFYDMDPGASYEVRARGPATGTLMLEHSEGAVIVTGWPGCIISVHTLRRLGWPGRRTRSTPPSTAPTLAVCDTLRGGDDEDTLV